MRDRPVAARATRQERSSRPQFRKRRSAAISTQGTREVIPFGEFQRVRLACAETPRGVELLSRTTSRTSGSRCPQHEGTKALAEDRCTRDLRPTSGSRLARCERRPVSTTPLNARTGLWTPPGEIGASVEEISNSSRDGVHRRAVRPRADV
jgi:hypothetical protein